MPPVSLYNQIQFGYVKVTPRSPPEHRFLDKVNKDGPIHPVLKTRCWPWIPCGKDGRCGVLSVNGRLVKAPRFSYEYHIGPIEDGRLVLHHCDNPACVNPDHLFLGTHQDNVLDMLAKGRGVSSSKTAANGNIAKKLIAKAIYAPIMSYLRQLRDSGLSYVAIARRLNAEGYRARKGGPWRPSMVDRLLQRYGGAG
jgi:hypothetical protein